jgi:hypothetical protein
MKSEEEEELLYEYHQHCIEEIKLYMQNNDILRIYQFLLQNLGFVFYHDKFRNVVIEKAKELSIQCDDKMNTVEDDESRNKFLELKSVLQEFLDKDSEF